MNRPHRVHTYEVTSPVPSFGLLPGDVVIIDPNPGAPEPICFERQLPMPVITLIDLVLAGTLKDLVDGRAAKEVVALMKFLCPDLQLPAPTVSRSDVDAALGLLEHPPAGHVPPEEPFGALFLNTAEGMISWGRRQIERENSRTCRTCHAEFEPGPRRRVRCPECLAKARKRKEEGQ